MRKGLAFVMMAVVVACMGIVPVQAKSKKQLENEGWVCGEVGTPGLQGVEPVTACTDCEKNPATGKWTCTTVYCDKDGENCQRVATISMPLDLLEEASLGYWLAGVGDVNGDAMPDLAIGDFTSGQAFVFSGADGALLYTFKGPVIQLEEYVGTFGTR
jgi:hypothetical protein